MKTSGLKRGVVLGVAASALFLTAGCSDTQRGPQGPQYVPSSSEQAPGTGGSGVSEAQQPVDINPVPGQEGFKTVPPEQTLPNGIQQEPGRGGSGVQQPVDINPVPGQEGFKTVPPAQTLPDGIGPKEKKHLQDKHLLGD